MQFFNVINGWAGRNDLLDMVMRLFYVGALPLMATMLAALYCFYPRRSELPAAWQIIGAAVLCSGLMTITMIFVNTFALQKLQTEIIAPRPFLTHWVNALVVEPNDNSFPCPEVMLAASLALIIWSVAPRAALPAFGLLLFHGFVRVFCGTNYPQDIIAGAAIGLAYGLLALGVFAVPLRTTLRWPNSDPRLFTCRPRLAAGLSVAAIFLIIGSTFGLMARNPRFEKKLSALFHGNKVAVVPPVPQPTVKPKDSPTLLPSLAKPVTVMHEGDPTGGAAPLPAGAGQDGHVPDAERILSAALVKLSLPHRLISVDVAEVDTGPTGAVPYRCAAIRFEVATSGPNERSRVTETSATIIKCAFQTDALLQTVDVVGVVVNGKIVNRPRMVFTPGLIPVFTASVQRSSLQLNGAQAWTNLPGVDSNAWLTSRSRLFVDTKVLLEGSTATPIAAAAPTGAVPTAPVLPTQAAPTAAIPTGAAPNATTPARTTANATSQNPGAH